MDRSKQDIRKRAFKEPEAAEYLAVSRSFLRQDRMNGPRERRTPGPRYIRIGRVIRYLKEDLDAWLDQFSSDDKTVRQNLLRAAHRVRRIPARRHK